MRHKLLFLLYLLAVTGLLLGAAEVALRLVDYTPDGMLLPRFHDALWGDMEPRIAVREQVNPNLAFTASTDARGFRANGATPRPEQPGATRILCLGDSYTFGYGVDDAQTYPAQLESLLARAYPEAGVAVLNAGVPRYGLDDAISFFRRKGPAIKPSLVIFQFFLNDLQDMVRQPPFGDFLLQNFQAPRPNALQRLAGRTELYRFAQKLNIARANRTPAYASDEQRRLFVQGSPFRDSLTPRQRELVSTYEGIVSEASAEELSPLWQEYREKILLLRDMVEREGSRFLFVIVPDDHQVSRYQLTASACLARFLHDAGVDVLDCTSPFMAATFEGDAALYLAADPHCSPAGNGLIARLIADGLTVGSGKAVWTAPEPALRDSQSRQKAALRFAPRRNALVPASPDGPTVVVSQDNVDIIGNDAFGVALAAPETADRPGVLDLRLASDTPAAFLDAVFHYQLPRPDSVLTVLSSGDGEHYLLVAERSAARDGVRPHLETRCIAQARLTPRPGQAVHLRFVLQNGAALVTDLPDDKPDGRAGQRPFELFLYAALPARNAAQATNLAPFPRPVTGDLFNSVTLDPSIAVKGLGGLERDAAGSWRWGLGPETEIGFHLPATGEVRLDLGLCNLIKGQTVEILANGRVVGRLDTLPRQAWLREETRTSFCFEGRAGPNTVTLRYALWNRHGAEVSPTDAAPYAAAITRLILRGLPE